MNDVVSKVQNVKTFWDKPEGFWGMCIVAVLGAGLLWFLSWFVPFMLKLGLGILGTIIVWGTIAAICAAVFTDNPFRQAFLLKLQVFSRKLRSAVINEDPIAILRLLQTKARKKLKEFEDMLPTAKGVAQTVGLAVSQYKAKMDRYKAEVEVHRQTGNEEEKVRSLSKYHKADQYHSEMMMLANGIAQADQLLGQAKKAVERIIEDAEDEINNEEMRLKATTQYSGLMGKLRSIFKASTTEEETRMEAMRAATDQVAARLGQIEQFTSDFKELLSNVGTSDAINAQMARQKLDSLKGYVLENKQANISHIPYREDLSINTQQIPNKR